MQMGVISPSKSPDENHFISSALLYGASHSFLDTLSLFRHQLANGSPVIEAMIFSAYVIQVSQCEKFRRYPVPVNSAIGRRSTTSMNFVQTPV
jgi:hypothetical protein